MLPVTRQEVPVCGPESGDPCFRTSKEGKMTLLGGGGAIGEMTGLERYLLSDSEWKREGGLRDGAEVPGLCSD